MRLAFAVAAHMEPEILLVDEVLAVGDINFQKRCLGKMCDVARAGRTILLVSHNMAAITRLCNRAVRLDHGEVVQCGPVEEVVAKYLSIGGEAQGERRWGDPAYAPGAPNFALQEVRVLNDSGFVAGSVDIRKTFAVEMQFAVFRSLRNVRIALRVLSADGTVVFTSSESATSAWDGSTRDPGIYLSRCEIPGNLLNEGHYTLTISMDVPFSEIYFIEDGVLGFAVEQTGGVSGRYPERWPGVTCPALVWNTRCVRKLELAGTS